MATHRSLAAFARSLTALVALGGAMLLAGCGGGSGAPNNAFAPAPTALEILPGSATLYASSPTVFTISGGSEPYSVFSSDASVLPLTQQVPDNTVLALPANVNADTSVTITVRDSLGRSAAAAALVRPAPLINGLTIAADASPTSCGGTGAVTTGNAVVCSGDTGTATVRLTGPGGTSLAGRQVLFEVVQGNFAFFSGATQAASVTVTTDQTGTAIARFQAGVNAPSGFALIRATDVTTNNRVTASFTIAQITDGSNTLRVVPDTATITSAFKGICSTGFITDYYIFGGTPPYRAVASFPNAVVLTNNPVQVNGGAFRATTTGVCVDPLNIAITDATGRTVTVELINQAGTEDPPAAPDPAALLLSPTAYTVTAGSDATCRGRTYPFVVAGGTPPYNISALAPGVGGTATTPTINSGNPTAPQVVNSSGGTFTVTGAPLGVTTVTVIDSGVGAARKSLTATITCN